MNQQKTNINFYEQNYEIMGQWFIKPSKRIVLGDMTKRICRFCGKQSPEVSFTKVAHAIPESLGNKSIVSAYECDKCNEGFGEGIENDLGNWSKPMRTLLRIRGKNGVPTLKKGGDKPGWRIEYDQYRLNISAYEHDPIFEVDEANNQVKFKLRRDSYTPVAVLKAFMKIGLTLMPETEVSNFSGLLEWVKESDHTKSYFEKCPIIYTFQPGPLPSDLIAALLLRRRNKITNVPYAFLILAYGNEAFQIPLPAEKLDKLIYDKSVAIYPFPVPGHPATEKYGIPKCSVLDWMDNKVRKGEIMEVVMGADQIIRTV